MPATPTEFFAYNSYRDVDPLDVINKGKGHVLGVNFVISGTEQGDISGELKELVIIAQDRDVDT